jgi:SAM-dependent methyltransferase
MGDRSPIARRAREAAARTLALAGGVALHASHRLKSADGDLQGDRLVEWSFCLARLAEGPGTTLDFGADVAFLSLAAAQRGHSVVALDLLPGALDYEDSRVEFVQADILERPLADRTFDQILNCSSIEHVGLAGRYGSGEAADGDLEAMAILRDLLAPGGRMILTIPVGRDLVCAPEHRIYGAERLPRLLDGFGVEEEQFWAKDKDAAVWSATPREAAVETEGSASFYSLGLFVLART